MKTFWKWIVSLLVLLQCFLLFFVVVENQAVAKWPFQLLSMKEYPFIHEWIPPVLLWGSLLLGVIVLIFLGWIWLLPNPHNSLLIQEDNGTLTVHKKAIEHFVTDIVKEESLVDSPNVQVKMVRNKVKVEVQGYLRNQSDISSEQVELKNRIEAELGRLIGSKEGISTRIDLKDYRSSKKFQQGSRVE